jgi:hypothetical protein
LPEQLPANITKENNMELLELLHSVLTDVRFHILLFFFAYFVFRKRSSLPLFGSELNLFDVPSVAELSHNFDHCKMF